MGGGLRLSAEFPLLLHGYYVEEIFARRFWLMNLAYRLPIWPAQDLVHLQLLADFTQVDYIQGHHLPRSNLPGVGANLSVAPTKRIDLVVEYGAVRPVGRGLYPLRPRFEAHSSERPIS